MRQPDREDATPGSPPGHPLPRLQDQAGEPLIPATPAHREPTDSSEPAYPSDHSDGSDEPALAGASVESTPPPLPPPGDAARPESDPGRRRRLFVGLAVVALVSYGADQLTKAWAVGHLGEEPRSIFGSVLQLELIRNPGAAFSIGTGNTWVLTLIAVIVLVVVIRTSRRLGSTGWCWALGLLLGGALGNLTDRVVREPGLGRGHVVDFINYNGWFIGNVADIAIVAAAVLIGLLALLGRGVDGTHERHGHREDGTDAASAPDHA